MRFTTWRSGTRCNRTRNIQGFELYGHYPWGRYQRNSGFVRVEKHDSFGLSFIAYYEFSKQLDDYSGPYGNQDFFNWRNDWALTSYNTAAVFAAQLHL